MWQLWLQGQDQAQAAIWQAVYEKELGRGNAWKHRRQLDSRQALDIQSYQSFSYSSWGNNQSGNGLNPLNQ
jgi:hypothetical protein